MAAFTPTKYLDVKEVNAYESKGIKSVGPVAYAATIALTPVASFRQYVSFAQLTGALTINFTVTNLTMFDEVILMFSSDGTGRVITFGTNSNSAGTLTMVANKDAVATFIFDGTALREHSRSIGA